MAYSEEDDQRILTGLLESGMNPKGVFDQFSCLDGVSMRKWLQQVKCGEVVRVSERVEYVRHVCHSEWSSGACCGAFSRGDSAFWVRWGLYILVASTA